MKRKRIMAFLTMLSISACCCQSVAAATTNLQPRALQKSDSGNPKIDYISCDTRELEDTIASMKEKLDSLSGTEKKNLEDTIAIGEAMLGDSEVSSEEMNQVIEHMQEIAEPQTVTVAEEDRDIILKLGESKTVTATAKGKEIIWKSADETVATVEDGTIKAVSEGSTFVFAKAGKQGLAVIRVEVKAN